MDRGNALIDKQSFIGAIMRDALSKNVHNDEVTSHFGGRNEIETVTSYNEFADILDTHHVFQRKITERSNRRIPYITWEKIRTKKFQTIKCARKNPSAIF